MVYFDVNKQESGLSKSEKTLFKVGQCIQYDISSHFKWVLVIDNN